MNIKLSTHATSLLLQCLAAPGWSKTDNYIRSAKLIVNAGELLTLIPEGSSYTGTLDQRLVDTCNVALKHHLQAGALPGTAPASELVQQFKLTE
jgi:hypothetical protein